MAIIRRNQAVATAGKSSFIYDYLALNKDDLEVFLTPAGQAPDDDTDRLTITLNYIVTGVGNNAGGTIELAIAAAEDDIITIQGKRPPQPPANFQSGQFSADELNNTIDGLTVLIEDIQTKICAQMVSYDASNVFNSNLAQNKIPLLGENEGWVGGINNSIVKINFTETVDAAILRAQLADEQSGSDGSRIVGFFNTTFSIGETTVHDELQLLDDKVFDLEQPQLTLQVKDNIILGGDFGTNPFQQGIAFPTLLINTRTYIADGWIIDQIGTLLVATSQSVDFPTIDTDGAEILYTNSLEIEIVTNQPVLGVTDKLVLEQVVEGNIFRPIAQFEEITVSFFVKSPLIGTYTISLRNGGKDRFIVKEYTISVANTWEKKTLDFEKSPEDGTWDYKTGAGLFVGFTLAAGIDLQTGITDTWTVGDEISTSNQVNFMGEVVGSKFLVQDIQVSNKSSLPLPQRDAQKELEFAQRYFEKTWNQGVNPGTVTEVGAISGMIVTALQENVANLNTQFSVPKRDTPVMVWYSTTGAVDRIRRIINVPADFIVSSATTVLTGSNHSGYPVTTTPAGDSNIMAAHFTANARLN